MTMIVTTDCLLSQVDESLITDDTSLLPPPPSYPGHSGHSLEMSLPGGGLVSLPLETMRPGTPDTVNTSITGSTVTGGVSGVGEDVLSVTAGEPATHINLDQILSIVQSFQLDTTHAGQENTDTNNKVS